ncbi:hypothetical protein PBAL39_12750 [Pedobacter sp. BAL39]|uniref:hypothetical protein n=1 Tax=Pedobacter sp. BAL39 TaxID=391596 RepID=UPI000155A151|nr:hypothetical protein [Pedobacter sp. BAL39]EDM35338.1 hypothetical protein PBAL39_12750 [Pedobacter sp. BAL39]
MKVFKITALAFLALAVQSCSKKETITVKKKAETVEIQEKPTLMYSKEFGSYYAPGSIVPEAEIIQGVNSASDLPFTPVEPNTLGTALILASLASQRYYTTNNPIARTGQYTLRIETDGNLNLYKENGNNPATVLWTSNSPQSNASGAFVEFTKAGDVWCSKNGVNGYWGSGTSAPVPIWVLQYDGNFVGYQYWITEWLPDGSWRRVITAGPFAATMTQGGQVSSRFGRLK